MKKKIMLINYKKGVIYMSDEEVEELCERLSDIIHQDDITDDDINEAGQILSDINDYYDED